MRRCSSITVPPNNSPHPPLKLASMMEGTPLVPPFLRKKEPLVSSSLDDGDAGASSGAQPSPPSGRASVWTERTVPLAHTIMPARPARRVRARSHSAQHTGSTGWPILQLQAQPGALSRMPTYRRRAPLGSLNSRQIARRAARSTALHEWLRAEGMTAGLGLAKWPLEELHGQPDLMLV